MNSIWPSGNRICRLFGIEHPIVQAGMVWVGGGNLAAAAANTGCLGMIGAGSMKPDLLAHHIKKAQSLTTKPLAVNVPQLYHGVQEQLRVAIDLGIRIFFTSAGSPKAHTPFLKQFGATVVHVTSTPELAKKCEDAGVDAVVVEGFEAGGHNGRDETTTLVLMQQMRGVVKIPVIAAGGIGSGEAIAAMLAMGADGVQIGTRFAATFESSAHDNFRNAMVGAPNNATFLSLKKQVPVRLLQNEFAKRIREAEEKGASREELEALLGKGRAKLGMLDGNLTEGELEVGQIVSEVKSVLTCQQLVSEFLTDYQKSVSRLTQHT